MCREWREDLRRGDGTGKGERETEGKTCVGEKEKREEGEKLREGRRRNEDGIEEDGVEEKGRRKKMDGLSGETRYVGK